ncbi:MAG: hypothetical protein KDB27_17795 [Planctomycetales bacterium]|nr:hypothetical protein [Planctomycetales bacterium]
MYELVSKGHVYVAQPPLFRVRQKKSTYYVQSEEEMRAQLLEKGLGDSVLDLGGGQVLESEQMQKVCRVLSTMEDALVILERRGISLKNHAERMDPETGRLPVYLIAVNRREEWIHTRADLDRYIEENDLVIEGADDSEEEGDDASDNGSPNGSADETNGKTVENGQGVAKITEFHEIRSINNGIDQLKEFGLSIESLIPEDRTGIEEPRYVLRRGETETALDDLRGLLPAVRAAGEKGLQVTRFKGLGEMNAEELRETTLDPENRTLLQVTMQDAGAADEMFRVLMGDKVEPRREFIEKHALDVKNLDV